MTRLERLLRAVPGLGEPGNPEQSIRPGHDDSAIERRKAELRETYPTPDLVCDSCGEPDPTTRELPDRRIYLCADCSPEWVKEVPRDCPFDPECNGDFVYLGKAGDGSTWRCTFCDQAFRLFPPIPWDREDYQ